MASNQPVSTGTLYVTIEYAKDLKDKDLFGKVCSGLAAGRCSAGVWGAATGRF
jgi:hypothetical protein